MEDREIIAKKLRKNATDYILLNLKDINLNPLENMDPEISIDLLLEKQEFEKMKIKNNKNTSTESSSPKLTKIESPTITKSTSTESSKSTPIESCNSVENNNQKETK